MSKKESVHIVGAGLSGSLLALRMAQRGYEVKLYEKRPDLRLEELDAGRSINLALSHRGLLALSQAGLDDDVEALCIPMEGRMIHNIDGSTRNSNYSGRSEHYINSISRPGLNALLLNELDKYDNAQCFFEKAISHIDFETNTLFLGDGKKEKFDYVFGSDGVGSAIRRSMMPWSGRIRFDYSQSFLSHGYKELEIPSDSNGKHKMAKNALHIWPRGDFMLIALPNLDGSFTVTLFLAFDGEEGFDGLGTDEKVNAFFEKYFPDVLDLMPDLINDYNSNPTSALSTVKCAPWKMPNSDSLLIGDAAHAIVPFYGQGMNASFEDVYVFENALDNNGADISKTMSEFSLSRKDDADAIADLAVDNFYEMRDHVDDEVFILKRKLEMALESNYPDYFSKYSLVTFRPDLSYAVAKDRGRRQDAFLMELLRNTPDLSLVQAYNLLGEKGFLG